MRLFFLVALVALLIIQFIPVDRSVAKVEELSDIFSEYQASEEIQSLVKAACYDCHSLKTKYPWYSQIAPVSWWMKHHVDEGREHLNFSVWSKYSPKKADHKLEECIEEVQEGEMPLSSYTLTHGDAKLSTDQKNTLVNFFKSLRAKAPYDEAHDD